MDLLKPAFDKIFSYKLTNKPIFDNILLANKLCGYGGIGRRVRFRFLWSKGCAGSSPVIRTKCNGLKVF